MDRCADIAGGVVQAEVPEMSELAIDPKRGTGIGEVHAFEEALIDGSAGNAPAETGECHAVVHSGQ